jgi:hypothetical protein
MASESKPQSKVDQLIEAAKSGQKFDAAERRQAIGFLMATRPDVANTDMADWFGVTERTIREDKLKIREQFAKLVRQEDVGLVVADILQEYNRQVVDIERSKRQAKAGSKVFLDHCTAALELRLKTVKALQDLGFYPKNLGNMVVQKFEYKAVVNKDGNVQMRPVDMFDEKGVAAKRDALDVEFADVPQKALPESTATPSQESPVEIVKDVGN